MRNMSDALAGLLARVEAELARATHFTDPLAQTAARHLLDAGGKRLRPLLTLLCAEFGDPGRPEVVEAAVVVELTHLATLYHDDVMDCAPLRRGAASAHERWGNHVAILTGDLLFARASALVAGLGPEAVRIQAETFERLCLGQLHETVGPGPGDDPVEFYLQVLKDKTASLTATAARFGAMFAGAPPAVLAAVTAYGEALGVAFQLADDVLDLTSETSGKQAGTDLREQVATMPVLLLRQRVAGGGLPGTMADGGAMARAGTGDAGAKNAWAVGAGAGDRELLALLDGGLDDDDALAAALARLRESDVVAQTSALARQWARRAARALDGLPPSDARDALVELAHELACRAV